jgi:endo-1,4-beta-D-glucanase Y
VGGEAVIEIRSSNGSVYLNPNLIESLSPSRGVGAWEITMTSGRVVEITEGANKGLIPDLVASIHKKLEERR